MQRDYVWFPLQAACNPSSVEIQHFGPPMASALMCSFPHPHKHTDTHSIKKHTWHTVSTFEWPHLMWTLHSSLCSPCWLFSPPNLASPWNQNTLKWKSPALTSQCSETSLVPLSYSPGFSSHTLCFSSPSGKSSSVLSTCWPNTSLGMLYIFSYLDPIFKLLSCLFSYGENGAERSVWGNQYVMRTRCMPILMSVILCCSITTKVHQVLK